MNIIEFMHFIIQSYPGLPDIADNLYTDIADKDYDTFALASHGDTILQSDIVGNQTRRHSFVMSFGLQSQEDWERLKNSGLLLDFALWLEREADGQRFQTDVNGDLLDSVIDDVTCDNGALYAIPSELYGKFAYQLQISVTYKITVEVF